jgi:hypothetical protein
MKPSTFKVIPADSSYPARIIVNTQNKALTTRLNFLSMWGGTDKNIYGCPSWEMGTEELVVAIKWCKMFFLTGVPIEKAS